MHLGHSQFGLVSHIRSDDLSITDTTSVIIVWEAAWPHLQAEATPCYV